MKSHNVSQHTLKSINRAKKELVHALFDKFDEGAHLGQRQMRLGVSSRIMA